MALLTNIKIRLETPNGRPIIRIAVIGAGSAGLSQIKQLVDAFSRRGVTGNLELVAFEPKSDVGGLWNDSSGPKHFINQLVGDTLHTYPAKDEDPIPTYEGLVANLPFELMAYRDHTFPAGTSPMPTPRQIRDYLQSYATKFGLRRYIRLQTCVDRLYKAASGRWIIESNGPGGEKREEFDYVSVANGQYSEPWTPEILGLSSFSGQMIHSHAFRQASAYAGKTVLVIGSYSSGSDITRLLATLNFDHSSPITKVYQSSSGIGKSTADISDEPWRPFIHAVPLIDHIAGGTIHFQETPFSHDPIEGIDIIIFATGYHKSLPFCKESDEPWRSDRVLREEITVRSGGNEREIGGLRGLHMEGMDPMLMFLKDDRSVAFLGLPYGTVPFPFAEAQSRLVALVWAGLAFISADHASPPNTANVFHAHGEDVMADNTIRHRVKMRREYMFPIPYEWEYTEYIFGLLAEVDKGMEVPECWRKVEKWRKDMRADTGLAKRLLGY